MGTFIHHPDGDIIINDFSLPLAEFLKYEPTYTLAPSYIGRRYAQDEFHVLHTKDSQFAGPTPWPEGDVFITKIETYRTRHNALVTSRNKEMYRILLSNTDDKIITVCEWMMSYLIQKNAIPAADVPQWIKTLLTNRKNWRDALNA